MACYDRILTNSRMNAKESMRTSATEKFPIQVPEGVATVEACDTGPEIRLAAQLAKLEAPSPLGGEKAGVKGAGPPLPSDG